MEKRTKVYDAHHNLEGEIVEKDDKLELRDAHWNLKGEVLVENGSCNMSDTAKGMLLRELKDRK